MMYHMPPEWAEHIRMFIAWPVADPVWADTLPLAYRAFAEAAKTIARFEPVTMLVNPGEEASVRSFLGDGIDIRTVAHDDCWVRDSGPTFVHDDSGALAAVHWNFNAWGGKYPNVSQDREVPSRICEIFDVPEHRVPIILEGGSIHTNGSGTIITTAECLLNPNRNPSLRREEIDRILCETLDASRVVYIPEGLWRDETDGHVDNIACFLDEYTVLLPVTDDHSDPNYERLRTARRTVRDAGFDVEEIVHPPLTLENNEPLTLSYVNFVYTNKGIILPTFGGELEDYDDRAVERMHSLFPKREIARVATRDIVRGGGNIHCITQQMPIRR